MVHQMAKNLGLSNLHLNVSIAKIRLYPLKKYVIEIPRVCEDPLKHLQKTGELCHNNRGPEGDFLKQP